MQPDNRCDKHLSPAENDDGENKEELGKRNTSRGAVVAAFILSRVVPRCLYRRKKIQEEADVIQEGGREGGRGEDGRGGGCDYYSVPTVKKNDVHVIVSCLLQ